MFANPLMLAGLGGAAVPVALHMLSRARYRRVEWGAMMFLDGAGQNDLRAHHLRRWILLGVRMLIVGLLAMALARPVIAQGTQIAPEDARVTAAIIVDCSASMTYDEGGRTRMDLARGAALQILSALKRGDEAVLLTTGSADRRGNPVPTSDLQAVANRVSDLDASTGAANFADALTTAMNLLDRVTRGKRQLFIVCDRQAASWSQITDNYVTAWRDRTSKSAPLDRFAVVPVGGEGSSNVSVESIDLALPPAVRGTQTQLEIKVRNYDQQPRVNVPVTVATQQKELLNTTVNLAARSTQTIEIPVAFGLAGSQLITANIHARGLAGDDRLDAVIPIVDPIRTLIVTAAPDNPRLLQAALTPYRVAHRAGNDFADITTIDVSQLARTDLKPYQVLILSDVPDVTDEQNRILDHFIETGGGVFIIAGDRVNVASYDTTLYRNGVGLLPAAIDPASDEVGDAPIQVDAIDHPIFRFLNEHADQVTAAVTRRFGAAPAANAIVLARTSSGEPLLLEKSRGRGSVLFLTTSPRPAWSTLSETTFFVPLIQSSVRYLSSIASDRRNVKPGEDLALSLTEPIQGKPTVLLPDGSSAPADVVSVNGLNQARLANVQQPGVYVLHVKTHAGDRAFPFVVQPSHDESDLTPISIDRWNWLSDSLGFRRFDRVEDAAVRAQVSAPRELWIELLIAVLSLLVVEMLISRAWFVSR